MRGHREASGVSSLTRWYKRWSQYLHSSVPRTDLPALKMPVAIADSKPASSSFDERDTHIRASAIQLLECVGYENVPEDRVIDLSIEEETLKDIEKLGIPEAEARECRRVYCDVARLGGAMANVSSQFT
jgi:hypothetical protein